MERFSKQTPDGQTRRKHIFGSMISNKSLELSTSMILKFNTWIYFLQILSVGLSFGDK